MQQHEPAELFGWASLAKTNAFFAAVNHDTSADNLAEIVDPICITVMASGPDRPSRSLSHRAREPHENLC
jgi:hypothetical protein